MITIAITSVNLQNARHYIEAMESVGARACLLTPEDSGSMVETHGHTPLPMEGIGGLLLSGGPDVDPALYGASPGFQAGLVIHRPLDNLELELLRYALKHDMPVLGICRGMQLLNVAFGGRLIQDLPGHRTDSPVASPCEGETRENHVRRAYKEHQIYLSPGSKTAAIIGTSGFFRVNSYHHQGLREPQKSSRLMATAYSLDDGLIEGLESPEHSWVIGLQCHPERRDEVPRIFAKLFAAFHDRAAMYLAGLQT